MTTICSQSSAKGVFSVEIWLANGCGGSNPPTSSKSQPQRVRVPIISSQSRYSERVTVEGGRRYVEHTLTIVTQSSDKFWEDKALRGAEQIGCIADVCLSSHGTIKLGWSDDLGSDQPLRLTQITSASSDAMNQSCLKEWTFKSYSTTPLI